MLKKLFEDYKEGDQDPLKGGLLVSRLIDNDLTTTWIYDELRGMAEKMQASYGTGKFLDVCKVLVLKVL